MKEYEFTLKFRLIDTSSNPDAYIEKLGIEGCDDALIGIGQSGRIALNFTLESSSAYDAIFSALEDVKRAIPNARLVEATPDFVGLTESSLSESCINAVTLSVPSSIRKYFTKAEVSKKIFIFYPHDPG
jgi:hypothetical protein